jgi:hypothetical protein
VVYLRGLQSQLGRKKERRVYVTVIGAREGRITYLGPAYGEYLFLNSKMALSKSLRKATFQGPISCVCATGLKHCKLYASRKRKPPSTVYVHTNWNADR